MAVIIYSGQQKQDINQSVKLEAIQQKFKSRILNISSVIRKSDFLSDLSNHFRNYKPNELYNDIAFLVTEFPFSYTDFVRPICLPKPDFKFDQGYMIVSG